MGFYSDDQWFPSWDAALRETGDYDTWLDDVEDAPMIPHPNYCNHSAAGLCPACQEEHDADPQAWTEFGNHPQGEANWAAEQAAQASEAAAERAAQADQPALPVYDGELPF